MIIFRFTPPGKFTRIYIAATSLAEAQGMHQKAVWEQIVLTQFQHNDPDSIPFFDEDEDTPGTAEVLEHIEWFASWLDPKCWDAMPGPVAVDSHY